MQCFVLAMCFLSPPIDGLDLWFGDLNHVLEGSRETPPSYQTTNSCPWHPKGSGGLGLGICVG